MRGYDVTAARARDQAAADAGYTHGISGEDIPGLDWHKPPRGTRELSIIARAAGYDYYFASAWIAGRSQRNIDAGGDGRVEYQL